MLPFCILITYANQETVITNKIVDIQSSFRTIYVQDLAGRLYVYGQNSSTFGDGTTASTTVWKVLREDVKQFWYSGSAVLIRTIDDSWYWCGNNQALNPSGSTTPTWQNITTSFSRFNNYKFMCLGTNAFIGVTDEGDMYRIGTNSYGGLFTGNTLKVSSLSLFDNLSTFGAVLDIKMSTDGGSTYFLMQDGTVKVAGNNANTQCGFSTASNANVTTLTTIPGLSSVNKIAAGQMQFYALTDNGMYVCGNNSNGALGLGTGSSNTSANNVLKLLTNLPGVPTRISVGNGMAHIFINNNWYYSGDSGYGSGTGSTGYKYVFTALPTLPVDITGFNYNSRISYYQKGDNEIMMAGDYISAYQLPPGATANVVNFTTSTFKLAKDTV